MVNGVLPKAEPWFHKKDQAVLLICLRALVKAGQLTEEQALEAYEEQLSIFAGTWR